MSEKDAAMGMRLDSAARDSYSFIRFPVKALNYCATGGRAGCSTD
jgi:hypothetical protein